MQPLRDAQALRGAEHPALIILGATACTALVDPLVGALFRKCGVHDRIAHQVSRCAAACLFLFCVARFASAVSAPAAKVTAALFYLWSAVAHAGDVAVFGHVAEGL